MHKLSTDSAAKIHLSCSEAIIHADRVVLPC